MIAERPVADGSEQRTRWLVYALAIGLVLWHVWFTWHVRQPALGWGEDDAEYVLLSREVRNFSYRETFFSDAPLHLRYPPGYPALLAVVGVFGGESQPLYQAVTILCSGVALAFMFAAALEVFGAEIALFSLAAAAFSPELAQMSAKLMSEPLALLLTTIALWASVGRRATGARWPMVLAAACAIAAALTRTACLVVLAVLFVHWILQKRYRAAALLAVAGSLTLGPWLVMTLRASDAAFRRLYVADLGAPRRVAAGGAMPHWLAVVIARAQDLGSRTLPTAFSIPTVEGHAIDNVAGAALLMVLLTAGLVALWWRWRLAALYVALYSGAICVWRFALVRFLNPIIPLGALMMFAGAALLVRPAGPRWRHVTLSLLLLYFGVGAAQDAVPLVRKSAACDHRRPYEDRKCWNGQEFALLQAAVFIRDSAPRNAILLAPKEGAFYYLTGRQSINQRRAITFDSVMIAPFMRTVGSEWAVATSIGPVGGLQSRLLARACRDFDLVREFPLHTVVVRLRDPAQPRDWGPACEALAYWRDRPRLRRDE